MKDLRTSIYEHLLLKAVVGSHAYGTYTKKSDLDVVGIFIPSLDYILGLDNVKTLEYKNENMDIGTLIHGIPHTRFDTYIKNGVEGKLYSLSHFIHLAADCNPNMLEILFLPAEHYIWDGISSDNRRLGQLLLQRRDCFLSQKAMHTYTGYAFSQLKRINAHNEYVDGTEIQEPKVLDYIKFYATQGMEYVDDIKNNLIHSAGFKRMPGSKNTTFWIYEKGKGLLDSKGNLKTQFDHNYEISEVIGTAVYHIAHYKEDYAKYLDYRQWVETRNRERFKLECDYGFDTKHGSHLIRLLSTGYTLMKTGKLHVRDLAYEQFFSDIRHGKYTYDFVIDWADKKEKQIRALYKSPACPLPYKVDHVRIKYLLREMLLFKLGKELDCDIKMNCLTHDDGNKNILL